MACDAIKNHRRFASPYALHVYILCALSSFKRWWNVHFWICFAVFCFSLSTPVCACANAVCDFRLFRFATRITDITTRFALTRFIKPIWICGFVYSNFRWAYWFSVWLLLLPFFLHIWRWNIFRDVSTALTGAAVAMESFVYFAYVYFNLCRKFLTISGVTYTSFIVSSTKAAKIVSSKLSQIIFITSTRRKSCWTYIKTLLVTFKTNYGILSTERYSRKHVSTVLLRVELI